MRSVVTGFKDFITRGNVIELAVAVVIGAAFGSLINAVVSGLFNPLIAAIFGATDLSQVGQFTVNESVFQPGLALDALIKFLVIAAAVYLVIVLPLNALAARRKQGIEPEPAKPAEDVLLLQEIRDLLAAQDTRSARSTLTGSHPTTGAHAALAPTDSPRSARE
ncbi:large conductance mechanosensitive channel protein MscL [Pengzhenrongella sicca]|uniref:Large-conductance mechanosensitive channel n=1 Tax=Pengzhenrongella sicca TaxID=2819238 RepID=A0A8A4ZD61_9MICO|nr:large conductance mechanosensitive channel protein MscL [Pengzhenrongella sicca]QTE28959.1 large conductance mechanosensitive channel protein MscL [Pengzhenrongella sicca]